LVVSGMGNGTSNIVNSKSGGEYSSIGNMVESVDRREVCADIVRLRSSSSSALGMLVNENARDTEDREDLPSFRNCDVSPWVELDRVPSTRKKIGSFLKAPRTIC